MKTSLAASPLVPLLTAVAAAGLILGTLSSSPTGTGIAVAGNDSGLPAAETPPVVDPAAPPAVAGEVTKKKCTANSCTAIFSGPGANAKLLGADVTLNVAYDDGAEIAVGNRAVVVSTAVSKNAGKYKVAVTNVDASGVALKVTRR